MHQKKKMDSQHREQIPNKRLGRNSTHSVNSHPVSIPAITKSDTAELDFDEEFKKHTEKTRLFENVLRRKKELESYIELLEKRKGEVEILSNGARVLQEELVNFEVEERQLARDKENTEREWSKCPNGLGLYNLQLFIENTILRTGEHPPVGIEPQVQSDAPPSSKPVRSSMEVTDGAISICEGTIDAWAAKLRSHDEDEDCSTKDYLRLSVEAVREAVALSKQLTIALQSQLRWIEARARRAEKSEVFFNTKKKLDNTEKELQSVKNKLSLAASEYDKAKSVWQKEWVKLQSTALVRKESATPPSTPMPRAVHPEQTQEDEKLWDKYLPLMMTGIDVRRWRLEVQKRELQDASIVAQGNKATYFGRALADALMFEPSCPSNLTDTDPFLEMYGILPEVVIVYKDCSYLLDILDWRCNVKDIMTAYHKNLSYKESTFGRHSNAILRRVEIQKPEDMKKYLRETQEGKAEYELLKAEHIQVLAKHKLYLENRKCRLVPKISRRSY